jgi:hypothetical protein
MLFEKLWLRFNRRGKINFDFLGSFSALPFCVHELMNGSFFEAPFNRSSNCMYVYIYICFFGSSPWLRTVHYLRGPGRKGVLKRARAKTTQKSEVRN